MTEELAYVMGLFVGGGTISQNSFEIYLPVRNWGLGNQTNIRLISLDLATEVRHKFQVALNVVIDFDTTNSSWIITPAVMGDISNVKRVLEEYGLPTEGVLINKADLSTLKGSIEPYYAEYFISGICDTKGSVADSHRRFNNSAPTISIEIPGSSKNFAFVMQLCSWLHELGAYADQILYNHPCQHSPSNPYYSGWKKGFKIRFLAKEFLESKSFSLRAKAAHAGQLASHQEVEEQGPCENRILRVPKPVCIHSDIHSADLPESVRSKLFFHYFHVCALLRCPYAPIRELTRIARDYKGLISVLPLMEKGEEREIRDSFLRLRELYFNESSISSVTCSVDSIMNRDSLQIYPKLGEAIAYLFSPSLNGNRHVGSMDSIIDDNRRMSIEMTMSSLDGAPLLLTNSLNERGAIISSIRSEFNQSLIDQVIDIDGLYVKVNDNFVL